ncbi:hypothetical protein CHELA20_40076 [Hyphomicrobiales bacterium]|nr:hypothetical protein CHELA20_40076 [Hyphomicrobiales bacterium]CAH1686849.1 hypothetical protein CHELA41_30015 [Hyphomicrobiales bacterium]
MALARGTQALRSRCSIIAGHRRQKRGLSPRRLALPAFRFRERLIEALLRFAALLTRQDAMRKLGAEFGNFGVDVVNVLHLNLLRLDDGGRATRRWRAGSGIAQRPAEPACGGADFLSPPCGWRREIGG